MFNYRMSSVSYSPFSFQSTVPAALTSLVLPDSETGYTEGNFGKILLQKVELKDFTLHYNIYQIKEDLALDFRCQPGSMQVHAALKNDCHYFIEGMGDLYLAEGQYNIIDAENVEGTRYMEHGHEYRSLHVIYSPEMIESVVPVFPSMEEWLTGSVAQPRLLFKSHPLMTAPLKDIVDKVINCSYPDEVRKVFLEMKMREYLFLSVASLGQETAPSVRLTRRNIELIHESKHILEKTYDRHITITSVARQVGLNEFKLKAGFKKIFGISMFDYLVQTRMLMARNLLLETDKPIKEIAHLTGYATKQSFLNAFKKYFHDTPGSMRRN